VSAGRGVMVSRLAGDVPPILRSVGDVPTPAVGRGACMHVLSGSVQLMLPMPTPSPGRLGVEPSFRGRLELPDPSCSVMGRGGATCCRTVGASFAGGPIRAALLPD
jgi:hypothetical protein